MLIFARAYVTAAIGMSRRRKRPPLRPRGAAVRMPKQLSWLHAATTGRCHADCDHQAACGERPVMAIAVRTHRRRPARRQLFKKLGKYM